MFILNLIASGAIVANFFLALHGYMGIYQIIFLIVAVLALSLKDILHLNDPEKHMQIFEDDEEGKEWFNSFIDDSCFSMSVAIIAIIDLIMVIKDLN